MTGYRLPSVSQWQNCSVLHEMQSVNETVVMRFEYCIGGIMKDQTVLIVGASSGIGKACADYLFSKQYRVAGAGRSLSTDFKSPYTTVQMDVNDESSVQKGITNVVSHLGSIDVVIHCAGFGIAGPVEHTTSEEAKAQLETNFFGLHRVCRAVLPHMREKRNGTVIIISSIAGVVSIPFQAFYSASKFAMEGYAEALRMEVAPFGIRIVSVQPGNFCTGFTQNRIRCQQSCIHPDYQTMFENAVGVMEKDEINGNKPVKVAKLVHKIIRSRSRRFRYTAGPVFDRLSIPLKQWLPYGLYEFGIRKYFKIG